MNCLEDCIVFCKGKENKNKKFCLRYICYCKRRQCPGLCKNPSRLQIDFRWSRKCFLVLSLCCPLLVVFVTFFCKTKMNKRHYTLMNAYMRLTTMCAYVIFYFPLQGEKTWWIQPTTYSIQSTKNQSTQFKISI